MKDFKGFSELNNRTKYKTLYKGINKFEVTNSGVYLIIENDDNVNKILIDPDDIYEVCNCKWFMIDNYAATHIGKSIVKLHTLLLGSKDNYVIDHINGNTFDNRRSNLRHIRYGENYQNSDTYNGYYFDKRSNKFKVVIKVNNIFHYIGSYNTEHDAIIARDVAEKCLIPDIRKRKRNYI